MTEYKLVGYRMALRPRYVQYAEDILCRSIAPSPNPLLLKSITLNMIPKFASSPGEKGCTPFFEVYLLEREAHLLYSSTEMGDELRYAIRANTLLESTIECNNKDIVVIGVVLWPLAEHLRYHPSL
jgi:hypothetical protein